ncbi:MAG TPA: PDZ domain-containing protein [Polyangia bacterium]|jgi:carboxyl-terminal processing protease
MWVASMALLAAAAAGAPAARGAARNAALGDEIVALVREHFFDAARARAWAAAHRGYGAAAADGAAFAARTSEILTELRTSHTAFYPRGGAEHPLLAAVFQDGLKVTPTYASLGVDLATTAAGTFVRRVFPGGAGEAAGLLRGDRIVTVDGRPPDPTRPLAGGAGKPVRLAVQHAAGQPAIALDAVPVTINPREEWLAMQRTGSPARGGLGADLDSFRHAWPAVFRARFGADVPPVAPRILVKRAGGAELRAARELLGRTIATLKDRGKPGPEGVLVEV